MCYGSVHCCPLSSTPLPAAVETTGRSRFIQSSNESQKIELAGEADYFPPRGVRLCAILMVSKRTLRARRKTLPPLKDPKRRT